MSCARPRLALPLGVALACLLSAQARAHCDGLDGPVVKAAQAALAAGDVSPVLIWVPKHDEAGIRAEFERALEVRKLGPSARALADQHFFETLVRVHRAAEGAPYTGLAPAGRDLGPAIPAADRALASGDVAPLASLLGERVRAGVQERFDRARKARGFAVHDVDAGRKYVESYVAFIHYVEVLHEAAVSPVEGHYPEPAHAQEHRR